MAQQCVRQHEDHGAKPDIWSVFEYATNTPTLPETVNGLPADTISGMAYWLINHVRDPKRYASITVPGKQSSGARVNTFAVRNRSTWIDLCPAVSAQVNDPSHTWNVRFHVNGQDVTRQITRPGGMAFVGGLRLWPGQSRQVQVTLAPKNAALARRAACCSPEPASQRLGGSAGQSSGHAASRHEPRHFSGGDRAALGYVYCALRLPRSCQPDWGGPLVCVSRVTPTRLFQHCESANAHA